MLLIPIAFLMVAGLYVGWLSLQVGHFLMEGKSPLNIATELRRQQDASIDEADMAVGDDLTPQGVWNQPNIDLIRSHSASPKGLAIMMAKKTKIVLRDTAAAVAGGLAFGSPALFALAILGLFGRPYARQSPWTRYYLLSLAFLSIIATYFIYFATWRFYLLFLIFFCIWACPGTDGLRLWAQRSASLFGLRRHWQETIGTVARVLAVAAVLAPAAAFAASKSFVSRGSRSIKAAATSFASSSSAPVRIADTSTPFAFHARAEFVWMPYCDERTALRFLRKMNVTHIVLRSNALAARPYLKKWMTEGVSDARLIYQINSVAGEDVQVYELERNSR